VLALARSRAEQGGRTAVLAGWDGQPAGHRGRQGRGMGADARRNPTVLIPRPRRRIGRPRPQRPGPRYPHRPVRLAAPWTR
ncbi:hypothetical protein ACWCYL_42835, partial [Streptomyces sp. 900105755]